MGKLEQKVVIIDGAGDMHRGCMSDASKRYVRRIMLQTLQAALKEADTLEELGKIYIQKVNEL